jgi:hypothetical protein
MMRRPLIISAFIAAAALGVARAQMIIQDGQPFVPKASGGGGVTWTLEGSNISAVAGGATATTGSFSGTNATLLIGFATSFNNASITGFSDSTGLNTWTTAIHVDNDTAGIRCVVGYVLNPSVSSSMTVTYTGGSALDGYAAAEAWKSSGGAGSGAYDSAGSTTNGGGGTVTTLAIGSITPSVSSELSASLLGSYNNISAVSINTGSIDQSDTASLTGLTSAYNEPVSGAYNPTFSWTTAAFACGIVVSFEPHS